ncbi:MAG TPA: peptidase M41, partial [Bacteroidales bacterium]|nr:peptidase M41 [Bacteroidales bacterium]
SVLKEHMDGLDKLAEILIEKEVIFSEDLERIFGKRKAETEKQGSNTEIKEEKTQGQITNVSPAAMSDEPKKRKEEEKKRVKAEIKKEEPEN